MKSPLRKMGGIIVSGLGAQIFLPFLGVEGGGGVGGVGVVVELKVIFNFSLKYFFQSSITK